MLMHQIMTKLYMTKKHKNRKISSDETPTAWSWSSCSTMGIFSGISFWLYLLIMISISPSHMVSSFSKSASDWLAFKLSLSLLVRWLQRFFTSVHRAWRIVSHCFKVGMASGCAFFRIAFPSWLQSTSLSSFWANSSSNFYKTMKITQQKDRLFNVFLHCILAHIQPHAHKVNII